MRCPHSLYRIEMSYLEPQPSSPRLTRCRCPYLMARLHLDVNGAGLPQSVGPGLFFTGRQTQLDQEGFAVPMEALDHALGLRRALGLEIAPEDHGGNAQSQLAQVMLQLV